MLRALHENVPMVCWIVLSLLLFCALVYFLVGTVTKRKGISLKLLLMGEEYLFAAICSIVIFLAFSFPVALAAWLLMYFLMGFIFEKNQRILSKITHCERNKTANEKHQPSLVSQLNPYVTSISIASWIHDLRRTRRYVLSSPPLVDCSNFRYEILPFSFFATGTIGASTALLIYKNLVDHCDSFWMLLLENYASLAFILFPLYIFLYAYFVGNIFHYMHGQKGLFKILFAAFSIIMYIGVTAISLNHA